MRFIVFGAGAVGGVVGGRLAQSGHDVVLIARGPHLATIQANGLRIESPTGDAVVDVEAVGTPSEIDWRDGDVVLLGVKSQDTDGALDALCAALPHDLHRLPVACLQNGIENERRALRRFPNVYGIHVMLPADHLEPGIVQARSDPITGAVNIGRYPTGVDGVTDEIAAAFRASTLLSDPTPDVMAQKCAKLLLNLGNAVQALCGDEAFRGTTARAARDEGRRVFDTAGISVAPDDFDAAQRSYFKIQSIKGQPRGGGSTWQSLARGAAAVETDYLNGEIVMVARLHGLDAPINEALQHLTNEAARNGSAPGSMTADELTEAVERFSGRSVAAD